MHCANYHRINQLIIQLAPCWGFRRLWTVCQALHGVRTKSWCWIWVWELCGGRISSKGVRPGSGWREPRTNCWMASEWASPSWMWKHLWRRGVRRLSIVVMFSIIHDRYRSCPCMLYHYWNIVLYNTHRLIVRIVNSTVCLYMWVRILSFVGNSV